MSSKEYGFSDEVKRWAHKNASGKDIGERKNVHHIVPRYTAKKFRLDKTRIQSRENAIALPEKKNGFHEEIHEIFTEDDYIFLAIAVLGFTEEDFERSYPVSSSKKKKRRKKNKRRKRRRKGNKK